MGHPWNDGKYKIYIIKHLYKDKAERGWDDSGSCLQFLPKGCSLTNFKKYKMALVPFSASGRCWQKTGIHGSFVKRDAIKIIDKISEWRPGHRFKVCRLLLNQVTEDVVEKKFAIVP